MIAAYKEEIVELQYSVYKGELLDSVKDLYSHLLATRNAVKFSHPVLFSPTSSLYSPAMDYRKMHKLHLDHLFKADKYIYSQGKKADTHLTIWLVVDANKRYELDMVQEAMKFLTKTESACRLKLLFANPPTRDLKVALKGYSELVKGRLDIKNYADFLERSLHLKNTNADSLRKPKGKGGDEELLMAMGVVQDLLDASGLPGGYSNPTLFLNGRLVGVFDENEATFTADHFQAMIDFEVSGRLARLLPILKGIDKADALVKATIFEIKAIEALRENLGVGSYELQEFPTGSFDFP